MTTIRAAQRELARRFAAAGIDTAALDARLLVAGACKLAEADLITQGERAIGQMEAFRLERYAARRLMGEPVSRILGRREFWGMEFVVTPDTLDPRPDTETLVEAALNWIHNKPLTLPAAPGPSLSRGERVIEPKARSGEGVRILDLGTGTGCILIALLAELPHAQGVGVDISEGALSVSRENAKRLGVADRAEFRQGNWFDALESGDSFDLIVSNPPYIAESEMESLANEVKNHDPRGALTDEKDGLEAYKVIYPQLRRWLKSGGMALFEMGFNQSVPMQRLIENSGATLESIIKDLAGHARVVALSIPPDPGIRQKR